MQESIIDEQKTRNDLKAKRKLLFAKFSKNPSNTRLALEIRWLDDRISDLDRDLMEQSALSNGAKQSGVSPSVRRGADKLLSSRDEYQQPNQH